MKNFAYILIILCLSALNENIQAQTLAFPTAEGFGAYAKGGRGGKVVEVTNLEDDGGNPPEGSLRWALKQYPGEPITVVFRVSGIIELKGKDAKEGELRMKRENVTIAGQTAPGDGICIMGNKVNFGGSKNLIVRHLRFRCGTMNGDPSGKGSIGIENAENWIIDHCTFGWSGEENMTIYDNKYTTIQWCIVHEGLFRSGHNKGDRGYGAQWGGQNATFHHNLLAHNNTRSPRFNGARSNDINVLIDYVNNVNYNWAKQNSCYGSDIETNNRTNHTNFINNYYKPGPARPGSSNSYFSESSYGKASTKTAVWYMNGNIMEGTANAAKTVDNYLGLNIDRYPDPIKADPMQFRSEIPFEIAGQYRVTTETAEEAYESVLAGAGAFPRDAVDLRIVEETRTGTATGYGGFDNGRVKGIIDDPEVVGGYPEYKIYGLKEDSDRDGMPDEWETLNGLDPNNPEDRNKMTKSGYTALEVYLNGLVGEEIALDFDNTSISNPSQEMDLYLTVLQNKLVINNGETISGNLEIINTAGTKIKKIRLLDAVSVNVSDLASGVYIAKLKTDSNQQAIGKFIKVN